MKKRIINKEKLISLYSNNQLSINEIANKLNTTPRTIRKNVTEYKIPKRYSPTAKKILDKELLIKLYSTDLVSLDRIAKEFNTSRRVVTQNILNYGIPQRNTREVRMKKINIDQLNELYSIKRLPLDEIASMLNTTPSVINQNIEAYKIPKRQCQGLKPIQRKPFSIRQLQIIRGTLLGDGYLSLSAKRSRNATLEITHSQVQVEYLRWLEKELSPFVTKIDKRVQPPTYIVDHWSKGCTEIRLRTVAHPELNKLLKEYYPNGKKVFSKKVLDYIKELGLAIWYCDDGSKYNHHHLYFALGECTKSEVDVVSNWFSQRWGLINKIRYTRGGYRVGLNSSNSRKFYTIVNEHIPLSMMYKLELLSR